MVVGAVDKIRGNRKGYGAAFDEGFHAMGPGRCHGGRHRRRPGCCV
ncbi:MAG: ethanolamine utilization protein EutH [Oscillospiraceae bacterium]